MKAQVVMVYWFWLSRCREGEQERSGKRLDWMRGASVKRNPDGSIELVQAGTKKVSFEQPPF